MPGQLKFRPESVEFASEYVAINNGYSTSGRGSAMTLPNTPVVISRNNSNSKLMGTRIYFSSLGEVLLFHKNNHYAMQALNKEGRVIHTVVTTNEKNAHQYIDALYALRDSEELKSH